MVMLLRDVLDLDVVKRGLPEVLAGKDSLDRLVRWVHIADIPEIAPLLKGGELLLTSGLAVREDTERNLQYLRDLAKVEVAGVVITLGWSISEIPTEMVQEAERLHLPMIVLHSPIPFVEVTELVHSEIISRQYLLLQGAEQVGRVFTELVLHGAGVNNIVEELGTILGKPIVVEDVAHQVVKYYAPDGSEADVLELWETHSRSGHASGTTTGSIAFEPGEPSCAWIDIPLREDPWGRIHVLLPGGDLGEVERLAVDRAATAVALALLSSRDADQLANNAKGDLIADVRRGVPASPEQIYRRARALGSDLSGKSLFVMIVEANDFDDYVSRQQLTEPTIQRAKHGLLVATRKCVIAAGCTAISAVDRDRVFVILGIPPDRDPQMTLDELAEHIAENLPSTMGGLTATVGVSRECSPEGLTRGFEEAREAVIYGTSTTSRQSIYRFDELGLHRLILRLLDLSELPQFVESELGPLLAHDAKSSLKLLPTLQAYLQHGANKSATAKAIHLERRSLYHRLEKISKLLQCDLQDMETCTSLFVALKSLDVVQRSAVKNAAKRSVTS